MKNLILLDADLALFEGDGAGTASQGEGTFNAGNTRQQQGELRTNAVEPQTADTRATEEGDVLTSSNTLEERRKAYDQMIKGEYKDFYTQDTQKMIDRRFRETKNLEKQLSDQKDIIDTLMLRYGTNDVAELTKAIDEDDGYWEKAAFDAGMSVEQYKAFAKLERENKALLEAQQQRQNQEKANRQLQQWYAEGEALKAQFPDFNLEDEAANPRFIQLLRANVPVEHAYKLLHMDEIMNNTVANSVATAEKKTVQNIRARGMRPQENGTSSQSSFKTKDDVASLSKKDRAELVRRAARGDYIEF